MMWEVSFVLGLLSVISSFVILSVGLDKVHTPLKVLFLVMGGLNVLLLERGVAIILDNAGASSTYSLVENVVYPVSLWGLVVLIIIIVVLFIYDLFAMFNARRRKNDMSLFGSW